MKVLIETIKNYKGYKFFESKEEMDAYLGRHYDDIASYEILQEDDTASTNDILRGLAEECEVLHNKLYLQTAEKAQEGQTIPTTNICSRQDLRCLRCHQKLYKVKHAKDIGVALSLIITF